MSVRLPEAEALVVLSRDERVLRAVASLSTELFSPVYCADSISAVRSSEAAGAAVVDLDCNGFSVVSEMRTFPRTGRLRIVMLCERPHDIWLCRSAGADEVIVKPLADTTTIQRAVAPQSIQAAKREKKPS